MSLGLKRVLGPVQGATAPTWARPLAWASIDAVTFANVATIVDSFNVSSVTDNGTGDFTLNFALAMANTTYIVIGMVQAVTSAIAGGIAVNTTTGQTTTSVRLFALNYASVATRFPYNSVIIIGRR